VIIILIALQTRKIAKVIITRISSQRGRKQKEASIEIHSEKQVLELASGTRYLRKIRSKLPSRESLGNQTGRHDHVSSSGYEYKKASNQSKDADLELYIC
jgi:hypothetical protein